MSTVDISEDFKQNVALILDPGSGSIKARFSGDEKPHTVIRSVLGLSKKDQTECYFDSNIPCKNSDDIILKKPITGGMIRDWDSLERLWSHVLYEELKVCPEELLADVGHGALLQQRSSVCDMKRQCFYVSQDFEVDLMSEDRVTPLFDDRLPDGSAITLGNELFRGPEILFRPSITGLLVPGVYILAKSSLEKCWLLPRDSKTGLPSGPHRGFASWVWGSIVTCLSSFQPMWVKRQDYEEEGSSVIFD
uniref:Uncharacterized protein n=1 Tax=Esox lucius TaxID=8010 RepID=A0A3P8ZG62_ESOLU